METMPDFALPNSAELDPVVTEASSKASVPMLICGAQGADERVAAVAGLDGYPVDVSGGLVVAAATDRKGRRCCRR